MTNSDRGNPKVLSNKTNWVVSPDVFEHQVESLNDVHGKHDPLGVQEDEFLRKAVERVQLYPSRINPSFPNIGDNVNRLETTKLCRIYLLLTPSYKFEEGVLQLHQRWDLLNCNLHLPSPMPTNHTGPRLHEPAGSLQPPPSRADQLANDLRNGVEILHQTTSKTENLFSDRGTGRNVCRIHPTWQKPPLLWPSTFESRLYGD
ncbi:hypothetical protein OUZ56_033815 [Daphnia magna]|uniref:Uncharacterized protein n=1 Tax=Daphnia magna TaxID=35525 RepID=A0ABR0BB64_9CRUS|nr:hypothetical protein OUZ56_033815 [Daphnia magna]